MRLRFLPSLLAVVLAAPGTPTTLSIPSAQWKTTVTLDGAKPGEIWSQAEVWLAGPSIRMVEPGKGKAKTFLVKTGNDVYVWTDDEDSGLKMVYGLALKSEHPWPDYVLRLAEIREKGRRVGTEKVDGYACEIVEVDNPDQAKSTYWLASKLHDFPVQAVIVRSVALPYRSEANRTLTLRYRNTAIRIPGKVTEADFTVPSDVQFLDVLQLMMRSGRPPRH